MNPIINGLMILEFVLINEVESGKAIFTVKILTFILQAKYKVGTGKRIGRIRFKKKKKINEFLLSAACQYLQDNGG